MDNKDIICNTYTTYMCVGSKYLLWRRQKRNEKEKGEIEMINTDCFSYKKEKEECNALNELNCDNCKFYKTREQIKKEQEKYITR